MDIHQLTVALHQKHHGALEAREEADSYCEAFGEWERHP
jgi:hypothetical protein